MTRAGKRINTYLKLIIIMFISGAVGGFIGGLLVMGESPLKRAAAAAAYGLRAYGWLGVNILGLIYIAAALVLLNRIKMLMRSEENASEEAFEKREEQIDFLYDLACVINNIFMAVYFTGFGLTLRMTRLSGNWRNMVLLFGMIICGAFLSLYQVWLVRMMQKRDPSKKGDPADFKYNRDWIESCDEAERMRIYKTGYKAFAGSQWILIISWLIAFLCKLFFDMGNGPMIMVGIMWIAQMAVHSYYKFKIRKSRLD